MQCAFSSSGVFCFLVFFAVDGCSLVFIVVGRAWGVAMTTMGVTVGLGAMVDGLGAKVVGVKLNVPL